MLSSSRIKLFIPLVVFALLALVFLQLEKRMISGDYDPSMLPSALIGKPLPEFNLATLDNPNTVITSINLNNKAALLNVWATWCVSCRVEHAYLNTLAEKGITIFGLNYKDDQQKANQWLTRLGNPYQLNLFDVNGKLGLNMGVYGAPETYVLDANGIVRYRHVGVVDEKVWQSKILPLGLNW
ncbi:MAG TPA: DsbE family thiol:disulfide interchange protein [Cellvibrionales bacterium]|nr:DsbE family thiol:disulfide interchange protein [Cellvibrionales bacterium]